MVYYLKIADIGVKVNCPNNLYLFDEWKIFFEEKWGKNFLTRKLQPQIEVILNGLIIKGLKTVKETMPNESISLPEIKNEILYFNNLLNQGYLLALLGKMIGKIICQKGGLIMHSSGVIINNKAILIMGDSRSGKTTTLKKMIKKYKAVAEDEVAVFKDKSDKVWARPILFSGKLDSNLLVNNDKYEVGIIMTIKKDGDLKLVKMSKDKAVEFLLEQSKSLINNQERAKNILKFVKLLRNKVYILSCRKDDNLNVMMEKLKYEIQN